MEDICYYWALKRRSRFGVPLIRRLQVNLIFFTLKFGFFLLKTIFFRFIKIKSHLKSVRMNVTLAI